MSRSRLAVLLLLSAGTAQASTWADLWWTRDQQGQRLLDDKRPAAAAQLFGESRRRGYAELEAGHYAAAAKLLEPYRDVDSQYNRGNALAHTGQLQEALGAYDAALAGAPGNSDVIKNRDLVQRALDQQRHASQQQPGGGKQPDGAKNASGRDTGPQDDGSRGGTGKGNGSQQNSKMSGDPSKGGTQGSANGQQPASGQTGASTGAAAANQLDARLRPPHQDSNRGQQAAKQAQNQQLGGSQPGGPPPPGPVKSAGGDTIAAGPYGQTSFAHGNPGRAGQASAEDRKAVRSEAMSTLENQHAKVSGKPQRREPPSEQSLALDQWLRTIPDDSGELLQRKFMIEHLMKQQGNQP
jgi:Ca-activated chloride channel family protein